MCKSYIDQKEIRTGAVCQSASHSNKSTNTSGSGSDAMLITILIGTVQFGRFVKRLLVASKEEREKDQNNPDNLVRDVRSAIRTLIRMEGSKVGKINSSGTDGTTM